VKVQFASRGWEDYLNWPQDREQIRRPVTGGVTLGWV
jgi:hypothetical protein